MKSMDRYKMLLIQPENREINRFRRKQFNNFVQITMPYLAAFADERQYELTLVDEYNQAIPYQRRYDLVAITVNTPNAYHCYEISARFRQAGAKVVLGGPHATLLPEEAQKHCDYLLTGECEETWPKFLADFAKGRAQPRYEQAGAPSFEHLPTPRWDLLCSRQALMKGAVFATRGCPHGCRYCNLKQIYGDGFHMRPVDEVAAEIKKIKSKHFVFWDDNFFANKAYALALLRAIEPLGKQWAAQVVLRDCADGELLKAAARAGCLYLFVGLESFSDASLSDAGKPVNRVAEYREIISKIHQNRIMVQAGIVFGFDSDGPQVFGQTLKACEELGIDGATVSVLTPLPKTPIYEQFLAEGRLTTEDWSRYNGKTHVAFQPSQMAQQELYDGYLWFRRKFYSPLSFIKRMRNSKVRIWHNFLINLGYRLAIRRG